MTTGMVQESIADYFIAVDAHTHVQVAGAVGAAIAQVGAEHRILVDTSSKSADEIDHIVKESVDKATEKAVDNGVDPKSIKIVEKSIIPKVGVHAKVVGVLKEDYEDKDDSVNKLTVLSDESLPKPTDNPNWPYQSATDAEEDKKYGLPDPIISKKCV